MDKDSPHTNDLQIGDLVMVITTPGVGARLRGCPNLKGHLFNVTDIRISPKGFLVYLLDDVKFLFKRSYLKKIQPGDYDEGVTTWEEFVTKIGFDPRVYEPVTKSNCANDEQIAAEEK